ncbi:MAG: class I SAM-dependent methyltransferase [Xanthobacteraceae bacterium]
MIEFLLAACLLMLVLIVGVLYSIQDRIQKKLRDFEARIMRDPAQLRRPHTSSLMALYRIMDGKDWLPIIRGAEISPDLLLHIVLHIQREAPRTIIECGCGTSTVVIASALEKIGGGGHIYSIEEHPQLAEETSYELKRRGLDRLATIINAPLTERNYPEYDATFHWYDLQGAALPPQADMLLVAGPRTRVGKFTFYPAGPELMPKLAPGAHIFVVDADHPDHRQLRVQWRTLYPDLGVREIPAERGAFEMYFLDDKMRQFTR